MMEVFENGSSWEHTGLLQLNERHSEYDIKLVGMSPSHAIAITTKDELLFKDSGDLFVSPFSLMSGLLCRVEQVSCGLEFTVILTADKEVFSWGDNRYGQLGLGDLKTRPKLDGDCKVSGHDVCAQTGDQETFSILSGAGENYLTLKLTGFLPHIYRQGGFVEPPPPLPRI